METPTLSLLLSRTTFRHWRAQPRQTALLILIIALGIAVYFAIRLANRAAVASFQNFTELVTGESDWIVTAPSGGLPDSTLDEIRTALGSRAVDLFPVMETTATRPRASEAEAIGERETFNLLGIDLLAVQNAAVGRRSDRAWFGQGGGGAVEGGGTPDPLGFWGVFTNPASVFVPEALAQREKLVPGGRLRVLINENLIDLDIAGIIPASAEGPNPPETLLILDLPALQQLTGRTGRLDRIELRVGAGPDAGGRRIELRKILDGLDGGRWRVMAPSDRREAGAMMTRAFRLNLTILSLLALMVGLYLVFQALDGAVVRRREEIGILRSLGVTAGAIRTAWLAEAALLGVAGGLVGALLGWAGAQGAVRLVGQTVNALYYATSARSASMSFGELLGALGLAVGSAVVAGWLPSRSAASTPPAQILVRNPPQIRSRSFWSHGGTGLMLVLLGWLLTTVGPLRMEGGTRIPVAGYLAALLLVLGGGVLAGTVLGILARIGAPWVRRFPTLHLAITHLREPSGRHRLASAGLLCAVAMTSGMAILVASFDRTMRGWIERTFQADLYISSDGAQSASTQNRISPETWRAVTSHPAVADWNVIQVAELSLPGGDTMLVGAELGFARRHTPLAWRDEPRDEAIWDSELNGGMVLVSEAFLSRFQVDSGDTLVLPTPRGLKTVKIAGVFSDYGNERGSVVVDRRHFVAWFGDEQASSLILLLKPGSGDEGVRSELRGAHPGLQILTNAHLRREVLRIFRQTFAITYALEFIGVVVAVAGLGMTLAAVLLERRSELTTLRALGMGHGEIARATAAEGALLALVGGVGGIGISLGLGALLIFVVNRQTFGWTLQYTVPGGQLGWLALLVVVSGTAVAYGVGRWGAVLPADREE
jgi:putative ABC transport system permease protein